MKTLHKIGLLAIASTLMLCKESPQRVFTENDITIIPKPKDLQLHKGQFEFDNDTKLVITNETQNEVAGILADHFQQVAGYNMETVEDMPSSNYIHFIYDVKVNDESYELIVEKEGIKIYAKDNGGFLYAIETIFQILPPAIEGNQKTNSQWVMPTLHIKDGPRFQHRGVMLDLSRHFFGKDYIQKTIDRMVMHKFNVLHLHLVDDQGWRIEIKKYPKLTEIGAWRVDQEDAPWNSRKINDPGEKGTYGGYLKQSDLKEIVDYAQSRNIEIIPEIEMPAHVSSAIASYPELACFDQKIAVPSGGLWPITDIYCAGKETTFTFLEDVLDEVMEIFPSDYIHIGGDEATKTNWKKCPHCQKRIKEEGLKDVDELQSYFVKRIEKYINSKGKKLIGWDEILEGGLAPEATVMSWRGTEGGLKAAQEGHDVIMTPESYCYFNFYQGPQDLEPLAFNAYLPLSKVYQFDPMVDDLKPEETQHVLGGQANLWSEYITTPEASEYMLYPRLAAMSEVLWSKKESKDWKDFTRRLEKQFERYDSMGINYSKSAYLITSTATVDMDTEEINLSLSNEFPNPDIRYVLGDDALDDNALQYTEPIKISNTTIVKASLFRQGKPIGRVFVDTIKFHRAFGKKLDFKKPFNKNYTGDGPLSLVNVIRGSKNFHDGQWQAWIPHDMEVVIDLEEPQEIHQVILGTLENQGAGIHYPTSVSVAVSTDGKNFKEVGKYTRAFSVNPNAELMDINISFNKTTAQYIKVIATNLKKSPTGGSSWLFVDEILVN
nr:family 20 glycosylhydrolase [uncultured Allomuricauda sp.]